MVMIISEARQKYLHYLSKQLREVMVSERLYLQPQLSLKDVADRFEVSRNELSYIINTHLGRSFIDFVNEMRIDEAIRLIQSNKGKRYKINELSRLAGFSDRTTFCRVCKKLTGISPTELETLFTDYTS